MAKKYCESAQDAGEFEKVEPVFKMVPFNKIRVDAAKNSYRGPEEMNKEFIESMAEDIFSNGVLVPVALTEHTDGMFDMDDGHGRYAGLSLLVSEGRIPEDYPVPAMVCPVGTSEQVRVWRAGGSNLQRRSFTREGRLKYVLRATELRISNTTIAKLLNVSATTVDRDAKLLSQPWLLQHVRENAIAGTTAVDLIIAAGKNDRMPQFREEFEAWLAQWRADNAAEVERRKAANEPPLSAADMLPKNSITREMVHAWKTGKPLGETDKGFTPEIDEDRLRIPAYSKELKDLSSDDLTGIYKAYMEFAGKLEPVIATKAMLEHLVLDLPAPISGDERLKELGVKVTSDEGKASDTEPAEPPVTGESAEAEEVPVESEAVEEDAEVEQTEEDAVDAEADTSVEGSSVEAVALGEDVVTPETVAADASASDKPPQATKATVCKAQRTETISLRAKPVPAKAEVPKRKATEVKAAAKPK